MGKRILYLFLTVILSIGMFSAAKILAHADETSVPLTGKPVLSDDSNLLADYILHDGDDIFDLTELKIAVEGTDQTISPDQVTWIIDGEDIEGSTLTVTEAKTWHIACRINGYPERSDDLTLTVLPARVPQTPVLNDDPGKHLLAEYFLHDGDDTFDLSGLRISASDQYGVAWPVNSDDVTWVIDGEDIEGSTLTVTEAKTYHIACRVDSSPKSNELTLKVLQAQVTYTVTFNANGGSGKMEACTVSEGAELKLPACSFKAPKNKEFDCWTIEGTDYAVNDPVTVNGDITVTAKWKKKPEKKEEPSFVHEHHYEWEITREATPTEDGEMVYACTECGAVAQRLPISGYIAFNEEVAAKIRNAKPGAELVVMTEKWISFYSVVWDELAKRPDVTLVIDYKYNGRMFEVVVPAGTNVETIKNNEGYAGFLFLS